jgi:hypothetical protein
MCKQLVGKIIKNKYHHITITSSDLRSWHSGPKWQALSTTSCNNVISTNKRYKALCPNNLIANYINDLIQSLPSPLPTVGITHTWMGESWMVDGETSVVVAMKISSKSPSWQGARMEFLVLNRSFWWWWRNGSLSGKNAEPPLHLGQRIYVGGRRGRGNGRAGLTIGGDTSPTYIQFLMLHACFYTICLLFRYTSWHFYTFFGTNLLTSCHSASFMFSAIFVFQKWYTGNILGIGRNKFLKSYFTRKIPEIRRRVGGGPLGAHMHRWQGQPLARATMVWDHLVPPLTSPLRL